MKNESATVIVSAADGEKLDRLVDRFRSFKYLYENAQIGSRVYDRSWASMEKIMAEAEKAGLGEEFVKIASHV